MGTWIRSRRWLISVVGSLMPPSVYKVFKACNSGAVKSALVAKICREIFRV